MTVLVVALSDLHIVSTIGLCPLSVPLDEGGSYTATKPQRWLYTKWNEAWDEVKRLQDERQAEIWTVLNGDLMDGDHHNTYQLVSRNPATMLGMTTTLLEPVRRMSDRFFVVRGTEAHAGGSASWEERIAADLDAEKDPDTGAASWWVLRMQAGRYGFMFAHHGRIGGRKWTRPNALNVIAAETMIEYDRERWRPDFVVLSHYHQWADSYDNYPVRVLSLPGWTFQTAYVHRRRPDTIPDIGMAIFDTDSGTSPGTAIIHKLRYIPRRGVIWRSPKPKS